MDVLQELRDEIESGKVEALAEHRPSERLSQAPEEWAEAERHEATTQDLLGRRKESSNYTGIHWATSDNAFPSSSSDISSPESFMTASTPGTFLSARSTHISSVMLVHGDGNSASASPMATIPEGEFTATKVLGPFGQISHDYSVNLRKRDLYLPKDKELNWSGKGQHVTFLPNEEIL